MKIAQSKQIIAAAREILKNYGYFVDNLWHVNDVHFLCNQLKLPLLDKDEAMAVFDIANEQFDGEYGLSWPQLEKALTTYFQQKELLKELVEPSA